MDLWLVLIAIGIGLGIVGFLYGAIIAFRPLDRTWLEVTYGVGGTNIFITLAILAILDSYDLTEELWWLAGLHWVAYGISGLPQIFFQERKVRSQKKQARQVERKFNGERD